MKMNANLRAPALRRAATAAAAACAVLALALLTACATPPAPAAAGTLAASAPLLARQADFDRAGINPFARANLEGFTTFTLSNGIPVAVKRNADNRLLHLRLVLRGGSAAVPAERAGIEQLMLSVMARGSRVWPYGRLMGELEATSAAISAQAGFDSASYSLTTLDRYFDRLFPVWADTVLNPAFGQEDFDQEKTNALEALEAAEQDAWAALGRRLNRDFFAGHPYAAPFDGTPESLAAIDRDALEAWYKGHFGAERLFVVAVGDFDPATLRDRLERTIGTLPVRGPAPAGPAPGLAGPGSAGANPGGLRVYDYPPAKGVAYLRGDFPGPNPAEPDYEAAQIGMKMFNDLLFEVVRTRNSGAYTPGARLRGFAANYGSVTVFKTTKAAQVKGWIDQALAPLLDGRCLSTDPAVADAANGALALEPIERALPVYVAQYVNEVYGKQQTNAAVAAQMADSVIFTGDCRSYLLDIDRIRAVRAPDIVKALRRYLVDQPVTWGLLGDAAAVKGVDPAAFAPPAKPAK